MARFLCAFLFLALCTMPRTAAAWGPQGHRLVGLLAQAELTPEARREVARLLVGEVDPTLAGVANWADDLRDTDPEAYRRTGKWHYVNLAEDGCTYQARRDCPGGDCVVEAIKRQAKLLADKRQPDAVRRDALKFLVHFMGDLHQPLHAGDARDRGGNDTQVNDDGFGTNLHALWDSRLLFRQHLSDERYAARLQAMPLVVPYDLPALPPAPERWVLESCAIVLRPGFVPAQAKLPPGYFEAWTPLAEAQLRRAGSRLAHLLNAILR